VRNDTQRVSSRAAKTARDLLLITFTLACTRPMTTTPTEPYNGPRIILPDGFAVRTEVATDDPTRAQGLMFRDRVPEGTGMLFVFPQSGDYPFWMKNTLVPLDMVWLDDQRRIVHVEQNVPPCKADPCPSYPPQHAPLAKYVLELGAGQAGKHRVANGATLRFERLENLVVR
jgi:uncharacterized protein